MCNFIEKETPSQMFSCEFCEIFENDLVTENLWKTIFSVCVWDGEIAQILFTHIRVNKTIKGCINEISNKIIYICISSNSHIFNVNCFTDLRTLLKSLCKLCYKNSFEFGMVCVTFIFEYMKSVTKTDGKQAMEKSKTLFSFFSN